MAQGPIQDALDAYLAAFGVPGAGDIVVEGQIYEPKKGQAYLRAVVSGYARSPAGLGADAVMQENGSYAIRINRPASEGRGPASAIADRLVAYFKRGTSLAAAGQTVSVLYASRQPAQEMGDWISIPVSVMFFASEP